MATKAEYLVNNTVTDVNRLLTLLLDAGADIDRIYQRYISLGEAALTGYVWPEGYTQADFVSLVTVLNALPQLIVTDAARNAVYKMIASFQ